MSKDLEGRVVVVTPRISAVETPAEWHAAN
jgi:hypothetical protein